jgi:hypothetical protein
MARTAEVLSQTIADTTPRAAAERCMIIAFISSTVKCIAKQQQQQQQQQHDAS